MVKLSVACAYDASEIFKHILPLSMAMDSSSLVTDEQPCKMPYKKFKGPPKRARLEALHQR